MKPYTSYRDDLLQDLKDSRQAAAYLNAALEARDEKAFLLALRNVLEAQGGIAKFSQKTKINRVSIYKMLSDRGNPEWGSVMSLLDALGIRFQIVQKRLKTKADKRAA